MKIEIKISPDELPNFKGCFITGTAAEITPVGNIFHQTDDMRLKVKYHIDNATK